MEMVFDANSCAALQLRQLGGHGASGGEKRTDELICLFKKFLTRNWKTGKQQLADHMDA